MKFFQRIRSRIGARLSEDVDLIALWLLLLAGQSFVPVDHVLSRDDLAPWLFISLSAVAFLRGRRLGPGPHPMLTPRRSAVARLLRRGAMTVAPLVLLAWYDTGAIRTADPAVPAVVGTLAVIVALALSRKHESSAWNPTGFPDWLGWGLLALGSVLTAVTLGVIGSLLPLALVGWFCIASLLGLAFVVIGLLDGRPRNLRQRRSARRRDGKAYRMDLFPVILAFAGPSGGLFLLLVLFEGFGGLDFNQAYVGSLLVLVWGSVVFVRDEPLARVCVLHEVTPTGGWEAKAESTASSFEKAPEGSLRFNPLRTKRTRVMHPWLVPVRGARIAELDDPISPLWARSNPILPHHVLGDASFEPDLLTKETQDQVITLRIKGSADGDSARLGSENATGQTRRLVVLRAFPAVGTRRRRRMATYRWDEGIPKQAVQVLDSTTEVAQLIDGDIIVASTEGVARAYEVEIGALLYTRADVDAFRAPQLEDYVKAG